LLKKFDIAEKFALEPRASEWFDEEVYRQLKELGITFVSVDAPFASVIEKPQATYT
jgi:Protein of unknown function DUF72.